MFEFLKIFADQPFALFSPIKDLPYEGNFHLMLMFWVVHLLFVYGERKVRTPQGKIPRESEGRE